MRHMKPAQWELAWRLRRDPRWAWLLMLSESIQPGRSNSGSSMRSATDETLVFLSINFLKNNPFLRTFSLR